MRHLPRGQIFGVLLILLTSLSTAFGQTGGEWPQWRGANRDAKAPDFKAPKTWPKELTQKWKVMVGEGVATPAGQRCSA